MALLKLIELALNNDEKVASTLGKGHAKTVTFLKDVYTDEADKGSTPRPCKLLHPDALIPSPFDCSGLQVIFLNASKPSMT